MKTKLFSALTVVILLIVPNIIFGQAPSLGTASSFALFTSTGAYNNTGTSIIKGNIGSFDYNPMGFPPGVIIGGAKYGPSDGLSTTAASDVVAAYNELSAVSCVVNLTLPLAGQVLIPGVYCYGAAATLNGEITLNGQGNPDALFIIKIGGAFATVGGSSINLINSASPNNVYWQINGDFNLVDGSAFQGNVLVNGAINLLGTATLIGRGLSKAGAISTTSNTVTLGTPPAAPTVTITQPSCSVATGTITITAPAGAGMSYSIDGFNYTNTDGIFTGLVAGNYNITAKDSDGYISSITSVTINTQPATPSAPIVGLITQPNCTQATGSVVLSGLPNGSWTINPGGTTGSTASKLISGLVAGAYNFTVTNSTGCTSTASANVIINSQPETPTPPIIGIIAQPTCILGTGSVDLSGLPEGNWTINPGSIAGNTANAIILGLTASTTFSYTVTNSEGCTSMESSDVAIIIQPATPSAPIIGLITQPTCSIATGSVLLSGLPSGNWTVNPGAITGSTANKTITGLTPGSYNFTVTNTAGCTSTVSANAVVNAQPTTISIANQTTTILSGQTFTVTPIGAPLGTMYTWATPTYTGDVSGGSTQTIPQTNISGTLTIPSGNGTAIYTVTPYFGSCVGPTFTLTVSVDISCIPVSIGIHPFDGSICEVSGFNSFIVIANGTAPFTYQWQYENSGVWEDVVNGIPLGAVYINPNTETLEVSGISNIGNFHYRCFISNCTGANNSTSNSATLIVNNTPTPPILGTITQATCILATGSITLSGLPSGNWIINSGVVAGNTVSTTIAGLMEGTYNFTVTNDEGCTSLASSDVIIDEQPITPTAPVVGLITQPTCILATGSVFLSGLPTGTWTINPGAITGSNASKTISGLTAGTYNFKVTNATGCTSAISTNAVISMQPKTPTPPIIETITQPTCILATGSVYLSGLPSGNWTINPGSIAGNAASTIITGLAANTTFNYTVINSEGCTSLESSDVAINAKPTTPSVPIIGLIVQPTCTMATGSVVLSVLPIGNWTINPGAITGSTTSKTISGLAAGTYNFTVTNAAGCTSIASANAAINMQPVSPTTPIATFTNTDCTESTGTITISSPINTGMTYSIDGLYYTNTTGVFYLISPGTYTVTAKGYGGCISSPLTIIAVLTACITDLSVHKTVNNAYPILGGTIVFTIVANNDGSNDASGVNINDFLENGFTYISSSTLTGAYSNSSGVWTIGTLNKDASASLTIVTTLNSTGNYINTATIVCNETDNYLDNNTSTVTVYPTNLFIPEGFSPNNDGINDLFVIRAIENYPDNRIVIFNRWGNKVYESSPYYSEWNGKSTGGFSIGVGDLPSGTYFYLLDLGDGSKVIKGTVYLNR